MKRYRYSRAASQEIKPVLHRLERRHTLLNAAVDPANPEWHEMSFKFRHQLESIGSESPSMSSRSTTTSSSEDAGAADANSSSNIVITDSDLTSSWLYKRKKGMYKSEKHKPQVSGLDNEAFEASSTDPICSPVAAASPLIVPSPQPPPPPPMPPIKNPILSDFLSEPQKYEEEFEDLPKLNLKPVPIAKKQNSKWTSCCYVTVMLLVFVCFFGLLSAIGGIVYLEKFAPRHVTDDEEIPIATVPPGIPVDSRDEGTVLVDTTRVESSGNEVNVDSSSRDTAFSSRSGDVYLSEDDSHADDEMSIETKPQPPKSVKNSQTPGYSAPSEQPNSVLTVEGQELDREALGEYENDEQLNHDTEGTLFFRNLHGSPSQFPGIDSVQDTLQDVNPPFSEHATARGDQKASNPTIDNSGPAHRKAFESLEPNLVMPDRLRPKPTVSHGTQQISFNGHSPAKEFNWQEIFSTNMETAHSPDPSVDSSDLLKGIPKPSEIFPAVLGFQSVTENLPDVRDKIDRKPSSEKFQVYPHKVSSTPVRGHQQISSVIYQTPDVATSSGVNPGSDFQYSSYVEEDPRILYETEEDKGVSAETDSLPIIYQDGAFNVPVAYSSKDYAIFTHPRPSTAGKVQNQFVNEDVVGSVKPTHLRRPSGHLSDVPRFTGRVSNDGFNRGANEQTWYGGNIPQPVTAASIPGTPVLRSVHVSTIAPITGYQKVVKMLKHTVHRHLPSGGNKYSALTTEDDPFFLTGATEYQRQTLQESIAAVLKRFQTLESSSLPGSRTRGPMRERKKKKEPVTGNDAEKKQYLDKLRILMYDGT